ncbi:nicotinamide riboside transporter PnuC [Sphingomonas bacterium]|uniref:nicotinamide riboside transporter PnuC n=1 Tax=Sphingomonas bacterium TaxID=1895847 RepID=UPI00157614BD|nr:nicotinamide riboside transporter PnuC [Sphingomonas bacterium]
MKPLEIVAALLGVLNILLLVRRSVWNYAFGLAMVALYAPVFFHARLYSDALLQIIFFAVQLYGLWNWRRSQAESGEVRIERLTAIGRLAWAVAGLALIAAWGGAMARWTDAAFPYLDAANAIISVIAQIMLSLRLIENWPLWILVDAIAIGLYIARGLLPTAALYVVMLGMSAWGWIAWRRTLRAEKPA